MSGDDYSLGTYTALAEVAEKKEQPTIPTPVEPDRTPKVNERTKQSSTKPSHRETVVSRHHDTDKDSEEDFIETVRKAVKLLGEKAATHRFTADEKDAIADIVYAFKKKGTATTENEITRVAINYLLWEHHQNKQASILSRVLERLNA